jgi:hypothetical protein
MCPDFGKSMNSVTQYSFSVQLIHNIVLALQLLLHNTTCYIFFGDKTIKTSILK